LHALADQGEQVLDLEALAAHKGSVLGELPQTPQPSQKMFDTLVLDTLSRMDPQRVVYVEAESKRIGQVQLPEAVFEQMKQSPWLSIQAPLEARVEFLMRDYAYWLDDPQLLMHLDRLKITCGQERVDRWKMLASQKDFVALVSELLTEHYDRFYKRSIRQAATASNSAGDSTGVFTATDLSPASVHSLAQRIVQTQAPRT